MAAITINPQNLCWIEISIIMLRSNRGLQEKLDNNARGSGSVSSVSNWPISSSGYEVLCQSSWE